MPRPAASPEGGANDTPARAGGAGGACTPFQGVLPLNLSRDIAAWLVGVSPRSFDAMVDAGEMPKPFRWGARVLWRRSEIEAANTHLGANDDKAQPNTWD